ncbi:MAG: hypothetical protein Q9163_003242 [Psora crenata]
MLSNCDAVNCPLDKNNKTQCVLGNTTFREIGISSFNSPLSPQPLTWTVAVHAIKEQPNTFERDFFLGTPPSLNLSQSGSSQSQACSLFFEGVAKTLKFPGPILKCANDLHLQAHDELSSILGARRGNGSTIASVCNILSNYLSGNAPTSCSVALDGKWGDVLARPLTGLNATQPIRQGECHPTTGQDYNLTLVAANRLNATPYKPRDTEDILFGITPIMTVVYGDPMPEIQIDLSCLKIVGPNQNTTSRKDSGVSARSDARSATLLFATIYLSASLLGFLVGQLKDDLEIAMGSVHCLKRKSSATKDLKNLRKRRSIFERAPVAPPRIAPKPKEEPHGSGHGDGTGDSTSDSQPGNPESAPVRIGTKTGGESSGQGEGNGPPRIAVGDPPPDKPADKPADEPQPLVVGATNPNDRLTFTMGESKDYGTLQEKGRRVDENLHTAIEQNRQDVNIAKLRDNYKVTDIGDKKLNPRADKELEPMFKDVGVDIYKAKYHQMSVKSKGEGVEGDVASGKYYGEDGIIIGETRFSKEDKNEASKKLRPSDIVYLQWEETASPSSNVNNLKAFIGYDIRSKSTIETMQKSQKDTGQPLAQKATFKRTDIGTRRDAFDAMQGTDFISSLNHLLKDHPQALAKRKSLRSYVTPEHGIPWHKQVSRPL